MSCALSQLAFNCVITYYNTEFNNSCLVMLIVEINDDVMCVNKDNSMAMYNVQG